MKNEEAIEKLEWVYQNGFDNDFEKDGVEHTLDALRKGIEALEKATSLIKLYEFIKREFCYECETECETCNIRRIREEVVKAMNGDKECTSK